MNIERLDHLTPVNRELITIRDKLVRDYSIENAGVYFWRPCTVDVLIVVDGLDFSKTNGFGLSTFVETLLEPSTYVNFRITLAHIDPIPATSGSMLPSESRIADRITNFKFDNPAHFPPDRYEVVFLFGIESDYPTRGSDQRPDRYPSDSLSNAELQAIAQFQNRGGGLFATGDHASLGRALCHKVARARNMRLWQSTNNSLGEDMVSMSGRYRNDTNRIGNDAGSQFDDQSDDVPQPISPVFYTRRSGIFRYSYPHPLLCGPNGVIRVMPDHPHEGECRVPSDTSQQLNFTGNLGPEYPNAIDGGPRPLPEIISHNHVLSGTISRVINPQGNPVDKAATVPQSFPGIAAYDGHRAGVGRVVTDATWHHFVNINLTGIPNKPFADPKRRGFLSSPAGQDALEDIKAYFRNLAIWLSPPASIRCMNSRLLWTTVWDERVLEAVLTSRTVGIERAGAYTLALIGQHARDALGRAASRCQSVRIILDLIELNRELIPEIDPWRPRLDDDLGFDDDELPVLDFSPVMDAALGGALVMISQEFDRIKPDAIDKLDAGRVLDVARKGAAIALERADKSVRASFDKAGGRLLGRLAATAA